MAIQGVNLLLAPTTKSMSALLELADVRGFFVLGRLNDWRDASVESAVALSDHPSCLGWLTPPPDGADAAAAIQRLNRHALVGVELRDALAGLLPDGVNFIVSPSDRVEAMGRLDLPLLVYGAGPVPAGAFGTVEKPRPIPNDPQERDGR